MQIELIGFKIYNIFNYYITHREVDYETDEEGCNINADSFPCGRSFRSCTD